MRSLLLLFYTLFTLLKFIESKTLISNNILEQVQHDNQQMIDFLVQLEPPTINSITTNKEDIHLMILKMREYCQNKQKRLIQFLNKEKIEGRVTYFKSYYISNTIAVKAKAELIKEISQFDEVKEISTNRKFKAKLGSAPNTGSSETTNVVDWTGGIHWSIKYINANDMTRATSLRASKLIYGNADTGVEYNHPALINNYLGLKSDGTVDHNYFWWDANKKENSTRPNTICGINSKVACDDQNHGSHTMSTVVGSNGLGVSPTTKWMACKNMDNNFGSPESYLGCLQFFLAPTDLNGKNPKPELRPHVIGNSYGCPPEEGCSRTTFNSALKALKTAGIFISVSAGNEGSLGCSSINSPPAVDPSSFTVAASGYLSNNRAMFSSMGPVPERKIAIDVTAPGVNITGAIRGGKYAILQGTSMAAPHVSGAALLIMAACPHLERKVEEVEKLLRYTATPVYATNLCGDDNSMSLPNNSYGYGIINVKKAIDTCSNVSAA